MLKNYFKTIIRNFRRYMLFSVVNVLGLAIGLASAILILLWVQHETSYDKYHKNYKSIYRITMETDELRAAVTSGPMAASIKENIPDVINSARVYPTRDLFGLKDLIFEEKKGFFADQPFLSMFDINLVQGDLRTALNSSDRVMISEELARKYFKTEKAVGRTILLNSRYLLVVSAVFKKPATSSHLNYDYLLSFEFLDKISAQIKSWDNMGIYTYLQLGPDDPVKNIVQLENKINILYRKHDKNLKVNFRLQALEKIHLYSDFIADLPGHGKIQYVQIFSVTAIFILLLACINFMNLSTARSSTRAKEIGLRKVIGAKRSDLVLQFLGESFFLTFLAAILALVLVAFLLPYLNQLAGKEMSSQFLNPVLFLWMIALVLITGFIAGAYPAFYLSSFSPVRVFKNAFRSGKGTTRLRSILVTLQFAITILLFSGTIIVYHQLQFMRSKNLGFDKEDVVYVPINNGLKPEVFKNELRKNELTSQFAEASELPVNLISNTIDIEWEGKDPNKQRGFFYLGVGESFLELFKMQMLKGTTFLKNSVADKQSCVINEKALAVMGFKLDDAVGKKLIMQNDTLTISGVVKDFNFQSLHNALGPMVMRYTDSGDMIVIKAHAGKTQHTIAQIERILERINPQAPFEIKFLEDDLTKLYENEARIGTLSKAFALLAIFISCLGLYGLVVFAAEQRTKEIGIRKVLGASISSLTTLLSGNFFKLMVVSILIAIPFTWYFMNKWLEDFAFHIAIKWWMFVAAGLSSLAVAIFTVSFQCYKAAVANPVKSLRSE